MSFEKFVKASEKMRERAQAKGVTYLSNDQKLEVYGLMQQGQEGNVKGDRPGIFSPIERAKWDAWKTREGLSKE